MSEYNRKLHELPTLSGVRGELDLLDADLIHMSVQGTPNTIAADGYSQFSEDGYLSVGVQVKEFTDIISDSLSVITAPNAPDEINNDADGMSLADWRILESSNEYVKIKIRTSSGAIIERTVPVYNVGGTAPTYDVIYFGNGNTSGTAPDPQIKDFGIALQISDNNTEDPLEKTSSEFFGWNTATDGTGTQYDVGSLYRINSDLNLYARWTAALYNIIYNANGGTGSVPTSQQKGDGMDLIISGATPLPTRTGYTLLTPWNTASDGTGTSYNHLDTYTTDADMTLYAQWLINQYTVDYDLNYADSGTVPVSSVEDYNVARDIAPIGDIVREGFVFDHWNTDQFGGGTEYVPGVSAIINSNETLYVRWLTETFTITYDGNDATSGTAPSSATKVYDINETISDNVGNLFKSGFEFDGWNTLSNGAGTDYAVSAIYSTNANLDLYAKWMASDYVITYNANGAETGSAPLSQSKDFNVNIDLQTNSGILAKEGFTFVGWNTAADGTGTSYTEAETYTINANLDLYAHWAGEWDLYIETAGEFPYFAFQVEDPSDFELYVDWGDGSTVDMYTSGTVDLDTQSIYHQYDVSGTYTVSISGGSPTMHLRLGNALAPTSLYPAITPEVVIGTSDIIGLQCSTFDHIFETTSLTDAPSGIFSRYPSKTSFNYTFYNCASLSGVPGSIFNMNVNAEEFDYTFANTNLYSIDADIFSNNVNATSFIGTFAGYNGTDIPDTLFQSNILALTFDHVFESSDITNIPSGFVANNPFALSFNYSFQNCNALSGIVDSTFENNESVTGYVMTFYNTPALIMNANLFGIDLDGHFDNGRTVDFTQFDALNPYLSPNAVSGTAPELWNVTGSTLIGTDAFFGNDEDSLLNWSSIPESWGGPLSGV